MNKLFVVQTGVKHPYSGELDASATTSRQYDPNRTKSIELGDLSVDYLLRNEVDVVASTGLTKEWYLILNGLKIVTVTFGDLPSHRELADIVIDHRSDDNIQYFTGEECSVCRNPEFDVLEILDVVKKLEWDSQFFGFPVAYVSCRNLSDSILFRINQFVKTHGINLAEYLCNCHDNRSVTIAEKAGFHFTDIRITFERKLGFQDNLTLPDNLTFGLADTSHVSYLKEMSRQLYKDSRYYFDGNFQREKIDEFFAGWVEKAVLGTFDHECYCFFVEEEPIGYCTIRYNKKTSCSIGLFGLASNYQGKGLGKLLLLHVFDEMTKKGLQRVQVVTQGRNYLAQRLYQQAGFLTKSTELWYHKWSR